MTPRQIPILASFLLLTACGAKYTPAVVVTADEVPFSYDIHVGAITTTEWGICLESPVMPLADGAPVQIVAMGGAQAAHVAKVVGACGGGNAAPSTGPAPRRYALELLPNETGIAIPTSVTGLGIVTARKLAVASGRVFADLDGDRKADVFKACRDGDVVHVTAWSGAQRRWHATSTDVDATRPCTPEESADSGAGS